MQKLLGRNLGYLRESTMNQVWRMSKTTAILNSSLQYHLEILCMNVRPYSGSKSQTGSHFNQPNFIFGIVVTIVFVNKNTNPLLVSFFINWLGFIVHATWDESQRCSSAGGKTSLLPMSENTLTSWPSNTALGIKAGITQVWFLNHYFWYFGNLTCWVPTPSTTLPDIDKAIISRRKFGSWLGQCIVDLLYMG